jgi:hypothetical protein
MFSVPLVLWDGTSRTALPAGTPTRAETDWQVVPSPAAPTRLRAGQLDAAGPSTESTRSWSCRMPVAFGSQQTAPLTE